MNFRKWDLLDALDFIRKLNPVLGEVGYNVGLAGSVLYTGESKDDLDLIVFPLNKRKQKRAKLRAAMEAFGMRMKFSNRMIRRYWKTNRISNDTKWVEVWYYGKKRVDILLMD